MINCKTCNQPTKIRELLEGAFCSIVCKCLTKGTARILSGNYFGWGK